jgi:hypothetical protein
MRERNVDCNRSTPRLHLSHVRRLTFLQFELHEFPSCEDCRFADGRGRVSDPDFLQHFTLLVDPAPEVMAVIIRSSSFFGFSLDYCWSALERMSEVDREGESLVANHQGDVNQAPEDEKSKHVDE